MKFLIGSKKVFDDFLINIKSNDKIGIIAHNDLDGVASAVLITKILENKLNKKIDFLKFTSYSKGMFDRIIKEMRKKKITKAFLLDVGADNADFEGFNKLRKEFKVLFIDHHLINPKLKNNTNIIKTPAHDCVAISVYRLGEKYLKGWDWLACSAIISDIAYKDRNNFLFVKRRYLDVKKQTIHQSRPGRLSNKISSAICYYNKEMQKAYNSLINENLKELEGPARIIRKEVNKIIADFKKNAEYLPDKEIYLFFTRPKYDVSSEASTIIGFEKPKNTIIIISDRGKNVLKINARNQSKRKNMAELMKKGIAGLKNAVAGGHIPAAGATIMKKDLERFKKNILSK